MLFEKIISNQDSETVLEFKGWHFSFPNSPDYAYLANEEKLVIHNTRENKSQSLCSL